MDLVFTGFPPSQGVPFIKFPSPSRSGFGRHPQVLPLKSHLIPSPTRKLLFYEQLPENSTNSFIQKDNGQQIMQKSPSVHINLNSQQNNINFQKPFTIPGDHHFQGENFIKPESVTNNSRIDINFKLPHNNNLNMTHNNTNLHLQHMSPINHLNAVVNINEIQQMDNSIRINNLKNSDLEQHQDSRFASNLNIAPHNLNQSQIQTLSPIPSPLNGYLNNNNISFNNRFNNPYSHNQVVHDSQYYQINPNPNDQQVKINQQPQPKGMNALIPNPLGVEQKLNSGLADEGKVIIIGPKAPFDENEKQKLIFPQNTNYQVTIDQSGNLSDSLFPQSNLSHIIPQKEEPYNDPNQNYSEPQRAIIYDRTKIFEPLQNTESILTEPLRNNTYDKPQIFESLKDNEFVHNENYDKTKRYDPFINTNQQKFEFQPNFNDIFNNLTLTPAVDSRIGDATRFLPNYSLLKDQNTVSTTGAKPLNESSVPYYQPILSTPGIRSVSNQHSIPVINKILVPFNDKNQELNNGENSIYTSCNNSNQEQSKNQSITSDSENRIKPALEGAQNFTFNREHQKFQTFNSSRRGSDEPLEPFVLEKMDILEVNNKPGYHYNISGNIIAERPIFQPTKALSEPETKKIINPILIQSTFVPMDNFNLNRPELPRKIEKLNQEEYSNIIQKIIQESQQYLTQVIPESSNNTKISSIGGSIANISNQTSESVLNKDHHLKDLHEQMYLSPQTKEYNESEHQKVDRSNPKAEISNQKSPPKSQSNIDSIHSDQMAINNASIIEHENSQNIYQSFDKIHSSEMNSFQLNSTQENMNMEKQNANSPNQSLKSNKYCQSPKSQYAFIKNNEIDKEIDVSEINNYEISENQDEQLIISKMEKSISIPENEFQKFKSSITEKVEDIISQAFDEMKMMSIKQLNPEMKESKSQIQRYDENDQSIESSSFQYQNLRSSRDNNNSHYQGVSDESKFVLKDSQTFEKQNSNQRLQPQGEQEKKQDNNHIMLRDQSEEYNKAENNSFNDGNIEKKIFEIVNKLKNSRDRFENLEIKADEDTQKNFLLSDDSSVKNNKSGPGEFQSESRAGMVPQFRKFRDNFSLQLTEEKLNFQLDSEQTDSQAPNFSSPQNINIIVGCIPQFSSQSPPCAVNNQILASNDQSKRSRESQQLEEQEEFNIPRPSSDHPTPIKHPDGDQVSIEVHEKPDLLKTEKELNEKLKYIMMLEKLLASFKPNEQDKIKLVNQQLQKFKIELKQIEMFRDETHQMEHNKSKLTAENNKQSKEGIETSGLTVVAKFFSPNNFDIPLIREVSKTQEEDSLEKDEREINTLNVNPEVVLNKIQVTQVDVKLNTPYLLPIQEIQVQSEDFGNFEQHLDQSKFQNYITIQDKQKINVNSYLPQSSSSSQVGIHKKNSLSNNNNNNNNYNHNKLEIMGSHRQNIPSNISSINSIHISKNPKNRNQNYLPQKNLNISNEIQKIKNAASKQMKTDQQQNFTKPVVVIEEKQKQSYQKPWLKGIKTNQGDASSNETNSNKFQISDGFNNSNNKINNQQITVNNFQVTNYSIKSQFQSTPTTPRKIIGGSKSSFLASQQIQKENSTSNFHLNTTEIIKNDQQKNERMGSSFSKSPIKNDGLNQSNQLNFQQDSESINVKKQIDNLDDMMEYAQYMRKNTKDSTTQLTQEHQKHNASSSLSPYSQNGKLSMSQIQITPIRDKNIQSVNVTPQQINKFSTQLTSNQRQNEQQLIKNQQFRYLDKKDIFSP